jgi:hypothetical protein
MPTKKMALADLEFQTIRKMLLGLAMMGRPDLTAYRREVMDDGYGPGYWIYDVIAGLQMYYLNGVSAAGICAI